MWYDYSWVQWGGFVAFVALFALFIVIARWDDFKHVGTIGILAAGVVAFIVSLIWAADLFETSNGRILTEQLTSKYGVVARVPETFPGVDRVTGPSYQLFTESGKSYTCRLIIPTNPNLVQASCENPATSEYEDLGTLLATPAPNPTTTQTPQTPG